MKRFKNVSNRHLQFFYAKIEMAPGQERDVDDDVVKDDPGFKACLEHGYLEVMDNSKDSKPQSRSTSTSSKKTSGKKESSKNDQSKPDKSKKVETTDSEAKKG